MAFRVPWGPVRRRGVSGRGSAACTLREVTQTDTSQLTKPSKQRLPQGKRISIFDSGVPQRVRNRITGKGKRWVPRTSRRGKARHSTAPPAVACDDESPKRANAARPLLTRPVARGKRAGGIRLGGSPCSGGDRARAQWPRCARIDP